MRLVILSDTDGHHGFISFVPDGDVLIHAGDLSLCGTLEEVEGFLGWFGALPHQHKLLVARSHDRLSEQRSTVAEGMMPSGITYLRDAGVSIEGINFWGSPWQPWFYDWAFNVQRGAEIAAKWALIPNDVHVLITHGPPIASSTRCWCRQGSIKAARRCGSGSVRCRRLDSTRSGTFTKRMEL